MLLQWLKESPAEQKGVVFNQVQMGWALEWQKKRLFFLVERESYPVTSYLDLDVLFGWTTHKPKQQATWIKTLKARKKRKVKEGNLLFLAFVLCHSVLSVVVVFMWSEQHVLTPNVSHFDSVRTQWCYFFGHRVPLWCHFSAKSIDFNEIS